jgi:hypothetical protein
LDEKLNVATGLVVFGPGESPIAVCGGRSTVQAYSAGVRSTFPAASLARTSSTCRPGARLDSWWGEEHETNVGPSSAHSYVTPVSLDEKLNVADVLALGSAGPDGISVSGGRSTVQAYEAGVPSTFPAPSFARTSSRWRPAASPVTSCGELHVAYGRPSRRHSNVAPPSLAEKVKVAFVFAVGSVGPERIVVSSVSSAAAIANVDRLCEAPHTSPLTASLETVTSLQTMPSKWSRRTAVGSANEAGSYSRQTSTVPLHPAVVLTSYTREPSSR